VLPHGGGHGLCFFCEYDLCFLLSNTFPKLSPLREGRGGSKQEGA
jgi:hypothetical protein